MTDQIRPPWTPEQVAALNRFQQYGGMHPFTCGQHRHNSPTLEAREDGWHCPATYCDYRQDWAHAFMAEPGKWPSSRPGWPGAVPPDPADAPRSPAQAADGPAEPRHAHDGAQAAQGGSGDRLRCPYCSEDITDYGEDDHVWRTGDDRPYCSGECVIAAHRAARSDVGTEFVQQIDHPDEAGLAAVEPHIPDGDIQQLAVAILRVQRLIDAHPIAVPTNLLAAALDHGAHDDGPSVTECAKTDDEHWNTKYAGEGA